MNSWQKNSTILGKHLEYLVKSELRANNFVIVGEQTNQYKKNKGKTRSTLDFIAKHKEKDVTIGVEVKNKLNLIERNEIDLKIELCNDLKIIPVFAVRWIKPHIDYIKERGGFPWIFKKQMYPLGQEEFVQELSKKLSMTEKRSSKRHSLKFPIMVSAEIPENPRKDFEDWLESLERYAL